MFTNGLVNFGSQTISESEIARLNKSILEIVNLFLKNEELLINTGEAKQWNEAHEGKG